MFGKLFRRFFARPVIARVPIAGLRYYRAEELADLMHRGDTLTLEHEADNPHDPDAIVILWNRNKIGYIPSKHAKTLHALLDKHPGLDARIVDIDPHAADSRWVKLSIYPTENKQLS